MNLITFYKIYYRHRLQKASIILKIYLIIIILLRYAINFFYWGKAINLDEFANKKKHLYLKDLNYLFEYFNSDKGDFFIDQYVQPFKRSKNKKKAHGYSKIYERYFRVFKKKKINILEIGSFYGNASAAMFFYFKNSNIYGADINPDMFRYKSSRVNNFYVNSQSKASINDNILNKGIKFNLIIEDASHMLKDQIISLFMLFRILEPGGIFIIEELDFPETREDMRLNMSQPDLKKILIAISKNQDFKSEYILEEEKEYFLKNIESIKFHKGNFNEIAILKKLA